MPILHLKDMPLDVRKIVLTMQAEKKLKKKVNQYSIPLTIYEIIREFDKMKK